MFSTADHGAGLRTAPIELAGDWGRMIPHAALLVVERIRAACLDGFRLISTTNRPAFALRSAPAALPLSGFTRTEPTLPGSSSTLGNATGRGSPISLVTS